MSQTEKSREVSPTQELPTPQPPLTPVEVAQVVSPSEPPKLPPLWLNRDYMLLWAGQTVSTLGDRISGIAFPLLILSLTGSPEAAGIAGALGAVPYLIFSLPVGALIDRWDRKLVMIVCDIGRAINLFSLLLSLPFGGPWLWQLYALSFIEGTLFVFFNIAEVAAIPRVVPKDQLPAATGQSQAADATAGLIGPGIGGLLYESVGKIFPFVLDAISFTVSVISLLFIKTNFQKERAPKERHLGREIKEGVAWLWNQPLVRYMAFLTGGLNFTNAAMGLVTIVRAKEMGAGEFEIGIIFSIGAIGGIVGSLIGPAIGKRLSFGPAIITLGWLRALIFPFYALVPNVFLLGAVSAGLFFIGPIYNVVQYSYRLALIPDELQGRVNSSFRLLAFGLQPVGAVLVGFLLQSYSVALTVAVFAVWGFFLAVMTTLNSHVRNAQPIERLAEAG